MKIIRTSIILFLFISSLKSFGQEFNLENEYFKKTRILGIHINLYQKFKRSYKTLSLSDSSYMLDKSIDSFFPKIKVLDSGHYTVNKKKVILCSDKKQKRKILNIKKRHLSRNVVPFFIIEEYCPEKMKR